MADLIDRKATLKHIEKIRQDAMMIDDIREASIIMCGVNLLEEAVRNQPSTQPEQAIKDCRNCKFGKYNDHWNTNFCYCSDDCNNWDKWEPSAQSEQKWIPCSERLPGEGKKSYWVCNDAGQQFECRWTNVNHFWTTYTGDWHWHLLDIPEYTKVVAWMPLPEPYKEEADDTEG